MVSNTIQCGFESHSGHLMVDALSAARAILSICTALGFEITH
jgi:hypothetical protein